MRIGVTTFESFRLFMQPEQTWMAEDDLLASIKGETIPNRKMLLGTAFGKCLEDPTRYLANDDTYSVPVRTKAGPIVYVFSYEMVQEALKVFDRRGVFEAAATKDYGNGITVATRADQLIGTAIKENKSILSQFSFDKYAHSYQWRFMLDMFEGSTSCTYHIFCLREDSKDGTYSLKSIETFTLYPYPELHQDCLTMVRNFFNYVQTKDGLEAFLDEKQRVTEQKYMKAI